MLPWMVLVWNELVTGILDVGGKRSMWYWDLRGKIIYALLLLIFLGVDSLNHWICYRLDNPLGHHDGEYQHHGRRQLEEIKCTEDDHFGPVYRNAPDAEWLTSRFVGIKIQGARAFEPFLQLLRDYLAGGPIPVLKQQYMSNMHGLTFYLSTVGDVIIAAQRNADALAAARLPNGRLTPDFAYPVSYMGAIRDGCVRYWNPQWTGHRKLSGAEAMVAAAPGHGGL